MNYDFDDCSVYDTRRILVLEERKSKVSIRNPNNIEILKVRVDNCLDIKGKKCDWLLITTNRNTAYYFELKGSDINHAFKQLKNSITQIESETNNYISNSFHQKYCYIIINRSPLTSTQIQNEIKLFRKKYGANLVVKKSEYRFKI